MIVVCNTSPLTNLAAIRQSDLLLDLLGEVHIANGVWDELNAGGIRWPGSEEAAAANWIRRHVVGNEALVISLMRDLDRGEAESIALALELEADLLLLDEKEGRRAAQRMVHSTNGHRQPDQEPFRNAFGGAGKAELREVIDDAKEQRFAQERRKLYSKRTILFV